MSLIYPELGAGVAREPIETLRHAQADSLVDAVSLNHPDATYPPVGATRADPLQIEELRARVMTVAEFHGFPAPRGRRTAGFDRDCAIALHEAMGIAPHAASSVGMWTFITVCVLPDVAVWRFPEPGVDRLSGHVNRNVFRRLWWRVEILGVPPDVPDAIWDREDVLVQIMERPGLSGNPSVARILADVFRAGTEDRAEAQYQELMRDFQLRIMRTSALIRLDLLTRDELIRLLSEHMVDTRAQIR